mgnify:CR=1 FL=1
MFATLYGVRVEVKKVTSRTYYENFNSYGNWELTEEKPENFTGVVVERTETQFKNVNMNGERYRVDFVVRGSLRYLYVAHCLHIAEVQEDTIPDAIHLVWYY